MPIGTPVLRTGAFAAVKVNGSESTRLYCNMIARPTPRGLEFNLEQELELTVPESGTPVVVFFAALEGNEFFNRRLIDHWALAGQKIKLRAEA